MKLEQIYESHYVNPLVAINSSSATDLLEAFEQAANECPDIRDIISSINKNQFRINENILDNDQRVFLHGATKLIGFYKKGTDEQFKQRFETFLEVTAPAPAPAPAVPATAAAPAASSTGKPGFLGNLSSIFKKALKGLKRFLKGWEGSEGKNKQGETNPGWKDVYVGASDLSKVKEKITAFTPQQLTTLGVDENTLNELKKGNLSGINLTDNNNNLVSVKFSNGAYYGNRYPTYAQAVAASKNTAKDQGDAKDTAQDKNSSKDTAQDKNTSKDTAQDQGATTTKTTSQDKSPIVAPAPIVRTAPKTVPAPGPEPAQNISGDWELVDDEPKPSKQTAAPSTMKNVTGTAQSPTQRALPGRPAPRGLPAGRTPPAPPPGSPQGPVRDPKTGRFVKRSINESFKDATRKILKEFYKTSK
jgi:hypothetical protein